MIDAAVPTEAAAHNEAGAQTDHAAAWLTFLASPAAPKRAMSALELDGYLTGAIVAPSMITPGHWMAGLWGGEQPVFDDAAQIQAVLAAVGAMFNRLSTKIEQSLRRLEAERVCDYRPAFLAAAGKPSHDAVTTWVRGFWKAMALVPTEWSALAADERTQVIIEPFVGFIDLGKDDAFEPAADIDDRLDEAAAAIPRAILLLKKIANLRAARPRPSTSEPVRPTKVGRNEPCPCGSGKKFKRCCGQT
jgi:uncharacterized protein